MQSPIPHGIKIKAVPPFPKEFPIQICAFLSRMTLVTNWTLMGGRSLIHLVCRSLVLLLVYYFEQCSLSAFMLIALCPYWIFHLKEWAPIAACLYSLHTPVWRESNFHDFHCLCAKKLCYSWILYTLVHLIHGRLSTYVTSSCLNFNFSRRCRHHK